MEEGEEIDEEKEEEEEEVLNETGKRFSGLVRIWTSRTANFWMKVVRRPLCRRFMISRFEDEVVANSQACHRLAIIVTVVKMSRNCSK
ncbi:hypothetical protein PV325_001780 [Microctonus aethiopoides]|nr:hypothetical protein PV325_001780 [Microctonus aethiopoides]